MWFKNLQIYRLPRHWAIDLATLDAQLARGALAPCPATSRSPAAGRPRQDAGLVYSSHGQWLLALTTEQRLLPASVHQRNRQERAEQIASEQGLPRRKQLKELREAHHGRIDAASLHQKNRTNVWINPQRLVRRRRRQSSQGRGVIEHLRFCLDEFPLKPLHTQRSPQSAMAGLAGRWQRPAGLHHRPRLRTEIGRRRKSRRPPYATRSTATAWTSRSAPTSPPASSPPA